MPPMISFWRCLSLCLGWGVVFGLGGGCSLGSDEIALPTEAPVGADAIEELPIALRCENVDDVDCVQNRYYRTCRRVGAFLEPVVEDCEAQDLVCDARKGCAECIEGAQRCRDCTLEDGTDCDGQVIEVCNAEGTAYEPAGVCKLSEGNACDASGQCANACALAERSQSYVGCEFFAVDLDNAALDATNNAAAQQYAIAVANPHNVAVTIQVEVNDSPVGESVSARVLEERTVAPNFLEVLPLPQREVDGSSVGGLNDGTHTALTSQAYRLTASHPVTIYQFNPLDNVNVFSNDASLLLPTSALDTYYTVVAWPQTIGDSDDPGLDFDATSSEEDLRGFLSIVGTEADTQVEVQFGEGVVQVVGAGPIPAAGPGDTISVDLGPYDVLNLETQGTLADFTGTVVNATRPVAIFVGSEASDVPLFSDYSTRQCCADHLEEQLFPDSTLGGGFIIGKMPLRTAALNGAAPEGESLGVAAAVESERVRVVAVGSGETRVRTTLSAPDDDFVLGQRADRILEVREDLRISANGPIAVLQALPSQGVTGIPRDYPGGDPAIVAVPPREQFRTDYIFLTPDKYAFDFVTLVGAADAVVELDEVPVTEREGCVRTTLAEQLVGEGDDVVRFEEAVVYRCQLSFPEVTLAPLSQVLPGEQNDGVHRVTATEPVGIVVYGFDSFVSYAYAGGLDLQRLQ